MFIIIFDGFNNFLHDKFSTISSATTFLTSIFLVNINSAASELLLALGVCSAIAGMCYNFLKTLREFESLRRDREESKEREQREQEEMKEIQDKKNKQ